MIKETFVLMSVAPIELLSWLLVAMVTNQEVAMSDIVVMTTKTANLYGSKWVAEIDTMATSSKRHVQSHLVVLHSII